MYDRNDKILYIAGTVFTLLFVAIFAYHALTQDKRDNMTALPEEKIGFSYTTIELGKDFIWDKNNEVAEISLKKIDFFMATENFSAVVTDQNGTALVSKILKHETEDLGDDIYRTDYSVQFAMPEDIWYIKCELSQSGKTHFFTIDYRDFKTGKIANH